MDEQRLSEIRARADAATPGPLTVDGYDAKPYRACTWRVVRDDGITIAANCTKADAELFATNRQDVPDLLEYIGKQQRELEAAQALFTELRDVFFTDRRRGIWCSPQEFGMPAALRGELLDKILKHLKETEPKLGAR